MGCPRKISYNSYVEYELKEIHLDGLFRSPKTRSLKEGSMRELQQYMNITNNSTIMKYNIRGKILHPSMYYDISNKIQEISWGMNPFCNRNQPPMITPWNTNVVATTQNIGRPCLRSIYVVVVAEYV